MRAVFARTKNEKTICYYDVSFLHINYVPCLFLTKYFKPCMTISTTLPTGCRTMQFLDLPPTWIGFLLRYSDNFAFLTLSSKFKILDKQQGLTDGFWVVPLLTRFVYKSLFLPAAEATKAVRRILHWVSQPPLPPTQPHNSAHFC